MFTGFFKLPHQLFHFSGYILLISIGEIFLVSIDIPDIFFYHKLCKIKFVYMFKKSLKSQKIINLNPYNLKFILIILDISGLRASRSVQFTWNSRTIGVQCKTALIFTRTLVIKMFKIFLLIKFDISWTKALRSMQFTCI